MLNYVPLNAVATFDVVTHDPDTGQIHDADTAPVYDIFEDTTDTPILAAQAMTKRTSKTGDYRGNFTASVANGFHVAKSYNVVVSATVTGSVSGNPITAKKVALIFRCAISEAVSGAPVGDASYFSGQAISAASGVTMPSVVASPTNITAGTITTVTGSVGTVVDISQTGLNESVAVPASNATPLQKLNFVATVTRNKIQQTSTTQTVRNDSDSGNIATSTVSDDGTTFTRGKFS